MEEKNTPKLGDLFTSTTSHFEGVIAEVVENKTGSFRVRLVATDGSEKWTTVKTN